MKRYTFIYIPLVLSLFALLACNNGKDPVAFGTCKYHPAFLWTDSLCEPTTKTFDFNFSDDAKKAPNAYAEFQFVDNDGKPIPTSVLCISKDDGTPLPDNRFRISCKDDSLRLTFTFMPEAESGVYQGYLHLVSYQNLDRIDDATLTPGQSLDVMQWTLTYEKNLNPLAKALLWLLTAFVVCLIVWFALLRPMLFPHFRKFKKKKLILHKDGTPYRNIPCNFKGARCVVIAVSKVQQPWWQRLFIGETRTYVDDKFQKPLKFTPKGKGKKQQALVSGMHWTTTPNPIPSSGVATANNATDGLSIHIN